MLRLEPAPQYAPRSQWRSLRRAKTGKSVFLTGTARTVESFLSCAILNIGSCGQRLFSALGRRFKSEKIMSDNVTLFPNILQPAVALKAYAPLSVQFWENQDAALESLKEFADGWFARRRKSTGGARSGQTYWRCRDALRHIPGMPGLGHAGGGTGCGGCQGLSATNAEGRSPAECNAASAADRRAPDRLRPPS